jgi:hypothetical protein
MSTADPAQKLYLDTRRYLSTLSTMAQEYLTDYKLGDMDAPLLAGVQANFESYLGKMADVTTKALANAEAAATEFGNAAKRGVKGASSLAKSFANLAKVLRKWSKGAPVGLAIAGLGGILIVGLLGIGFLIYASRKS